MVLINNLVKLQEIDSAIMEIEELQGDLPTHVEELSSTLTSLEKAISSAESRLLEIELEIRKMQTLQQDHKEKIGYRNENESHRLFHNERFNSVNLIDRPKIFCNQCKVPMMKSDQEIQVRELTQ